MCLKQSLYPRRNQMVNVERIATLIGFLTIYEQNLDMSVWTDIESPHGIPGRVDAVDLREPKCGTTACAAGWASILFCPDNARFSPTSELIFWVDGIPHRVPEFAREVLGLTRSQSDYIFHCSNGQVIPALAHVARNPHCNYDNLISAIGG
jgi:hypothetical protein